MPSQSMLQTVILREGLTVLSALFVLPSCRKILHLLRLLHHLIHLKSCQRQHSTQTRQNRTCEKKTTLDQKHFQPQTWLCGKKINLVHFCRGNMTSIMLGCNSCTCSILGLLFLSKLFHNLRNSIVEQSENFSIKSFHQATITETSHGRRH